jgi:hypothetical protein
MKQIRIEVKVNPDDKGKASVYNDNDLIYTFDCGANVHLKSEATDSCYKFIN